MGASLGGFGTIGTLAMAGKLNAQTIRFAGVPALTMGMIFGFGSIFR